MMLTKLGTSIKRLGKREKGFTLVELIVVIAVLTVIAAIVIPQFLGRVDQAKVDADEVTISQLEKLVMQYKVDNDGAAPSPSLVELEGDKYLGGPIPEAQQDKSKTFVLDTDNKTVKVSE